MRFLGQGMVAESWSKPEQWFQQTLLANQLISFLIKKGTIKKYIRISTPEVYGSSIKTLIKICSKSINTLCYYL